MILNEFLAIKSKRRCYLFLMLIILCPGCWSGVIRQVKSVEIVENSTPLQHPAWETFASGFAVDWMTFDGVGNLWTASKDGDGVRQWNLVAGTCVKHKPEHGLPGSRVMGLSTSGDGSVWVATRGGVANFKEGTWISYSLDELPIEKIWDIAGGPGHTVWVAGNDIAYFDGTTWVNRASDVWVESIAVDDDGVGWGTLGAGLAKFEGEQWVSVSNERIRQIAIAPDGVIWGLPFDGGELLRYVDEKEEEETIVTEVPDSANRTIAVGSDHKVWVAGGGRIAVWDGSVWESLDGESGVSAMTVAEDGTLWYALQGEPEKVYHYDLDTTSEYAITNSPPIFTLVWDLAVADDGTIWVTSNDGIFQHLPGREEPYWTSLSFGPRRLKVFKVTSALDGRVWFTTSEGVWVTDEGQSFTKLPKATCPSVQAWTVNAEGHIWEACTSGLYTASINHFDGAEWHNIPVDEVQEVTALATDDQDTLWLGTAKGWVKFWDGEDWHRVLTPPLKSISESILAIAINEEEIWFGTGGSGLIRYSITDENQWEHFTVADGLPSDYITSLTFDQNGQLWLGSDRGAATFQNDVWRVYTTEDGLARNRVEVVAVSSEGDVWFGTEYQISHYSCQYPNP